MGVLSRTPAPIDCDRPASADFLRVLAAWAVGAFHIWQQSWYSRPAAEHWLRAGSVGVDFLVMLSAFCLFLPWANAAAQGRPLPQTRPAEFYRRRAARLLPAYYASLLFSLVLAVHRSGWSRALAVDLFTHLTLTQQLFPVCYIGTQLNAVSWTLTVFLKYDLHLPVWQGVTPPNQLGDKVWMHRADMLYWAAALTAGATAYFLLEKPAAKVLHQTAQKMHAEKAR